AHNFGASFADDEWRVVESDLRQSEVVFVIHVMDGENGSRLLRLLDAREKESGAVIVINCMPELMKRTRMGRLDFQRLPGISSRKGAKTQRKANAEAGRKAAKQGD